MPSYLLPEEPVTSLDAYLATGTGGLGVHRAQQLGPAATIDEVRRSGLRGRGGGGFPTARKWAGIASQAGTRRYVVCNGAEGEPGTFKDRALMRANPYQLVEGLIIATFAVGGDAAFICIKRSFERETQSFALTGTETYDIIGLAGLGLNEPLPVELTVRAATENADVIEFPARVRIDTPKEADYYRHGGILHYVLRLLASSR